MPLCCNVRIISYFPYATSTICVFNVSNANLPFSPKQKLAPKCHYICSNTIQQHSQTQADPSHWLTKNMWKNFINHFSIPVGQMGFNIIFSMALEAVLGCVPRLCKEGWQIYLHNGNWSDGLLLSSQKDLDSLGLWESTIKMNSRSSHKHLY
jgi:hypothetical protein